MGMVNNNYMVVNYRLEFSACFMIVDGEDGRFSHFKFRYRDFCCKRPLAFTLRCGCGVC